MNNDITPIRPLSVETGETLAAIKYLRDLGAVEIHMGDDGWHVRFWDSCPAHAADDPDASDPEERSIVE